MGSSHCFTSTQKMPSLFRIFRVLKYNKYLKVTHFERSLCSSWDTKPSAGIFVPSYLRKPGETDGERRARLLYQSRKRGMLENDLILSTFVDKYLIEMNNEQVSQYDKLINSSYSDWDIYDWCIGARPVPSEFDNEIMKLLKSHVQNKKKEHRLRQPELPNHIFSK